MKNLSIPITLFLILSPFFIFAANPLKVMINEVAWMGTKISYNDEWLELYNNTGNPINLDGWQLVAQDGTPKINLSGIIPANGFYLLERTDDNTVPEISADQVYTGALGNSGENLGLYDNSGNLIDSLNCASGWFAGNNKTWQTMERKDSQVEGNIVDNWQTSQNPDGTPRAKNSLVAQTPPTPEIESEEKPKIRVEPEPKPVIYPSGILINEILPSPEGPDEKEEWIEIFNQNNFEVDLSEWQIVDTVGKTTNFSFSMGTKILAQGFSVISRPITKITLNNDGDALNLIQPNGKIIDSVTYEKAPRGQSYNRIDSQWTWSTILTPGEPNKIPSLVSENKEIEPSKEEAKKLVAEEEIKEEPKLKKELAAIGEQFPEKPSNFLYILLVAVAIAIFSGVIILILKKKVKNLDLSRKLE
jgi:hypothetical protein